ncbi:VIT domain-containing protein [Desulfatiglans anilini]|uniref:VIT domain-containing protein n=1 Tax=Desulfatiglans anilini TaxID=90728 RepID=UPI0003FDF811|nr:VIT domain-containing protein [Desulfatiglans anilini]
MKEKKGLMSKSGIFSDAGAQARRVGFWAAVLMLLAWAAFPASWTLPPVWGAAEGGDEAGRTLSPYFVVVNGEPGVDALPLKETRAEVDIAGVIADVRVTQVYRNEGRRAIEALYVFPGSTRSAVYAMKMTIGERVIEARIEKREAARKAYEQARDEGRTASLLEQHRPNVFQMNVANILPGDEIRVEMSYTEILVPEDRVYTFLYPTVVGPRYQRPSEAEGEGAEGWVQNPYLHEGEPAPYDFDIRVALNAGMPIREAKCGTHRVDIRYEGDSRALIRLHDTERQGGDRDFVLRYRLAGDAVHSGLLLYEGPEENFFLLMAQPPERTVLAEVPPREVIFVVDVSGSMHGFPLDVSKRMLRELISGLRPSDCFNVLLFAGGSMVLAEQSLPATAENIQKAIARIEEERGGGGTELLPALERAMALPRSEGFSRSILLVTDGYVSAEPEAFDLVRRGLGEANLFVFGIGSSVNRHLVEGLARVGMGEPFVVLREGEAAETAARFRRLVQWPVMTRLHMAFPGFDAYDVEPPAIPDLMADRPIVLVGKWRGKAEGAVTLEGLTGAGKPYRMRIPVEKARTAASCRALRYLWARQRVALLSDYNRLQPSDERIEEVTELGLRYHLLTAYTSFVAVDSVVREESGERTTVKQPLPLPAGVSDLAVGGMAPMGSAKMLSLARTTAAPQAAHEEAAPGVAGGPDRNGAAEGRNDEAVEPSIVGEKRPAEQARWAIGAITAPDGLDEAEVRRVVAGQIEVWAACLDGKGIAARKGDRVTVRFRIDPSGRVKDVSWSGLSGETEAFRRCLEQAVEACRFAARLGGETLKVEVILERMNG